MEGASLQPGQLPAAAAAVGGPGGRPDVAALLQQSGFITAISGYCYGIPQGGWLQARWKLCRGCIPFGHLGHARAIEGMAGATWHSARDMQAALLPSAAALRRACQGEM